MRHRVAGSNFGRDKSARKALFKNLISSLIIHGQIKTTEAKAKAIRGLVEKLVIRSRGKTLQARRLIFAFLQDKKIVNKLVDEVTPKFAGRPSGFTRILRLGKRAGDQAMMVKMEFVEGKEAEVSPKIEVKEPRRTQIKRKKAV